MTAPVIDTPPPSVGTSEQLDVATPTAATQLKVLKRYAECLSPALAEKLYWEAYHHLSALPDLSEDEQAEMFLFLALIRRMMNLTKLSIPLLDPIVNETESKRA